MLLICLGIKLSPWVFTMSWKSERFPYDIEDEIETAEIDDDFMINF